MLHLPSIHALLRVRHRRVFIDRQRRVEPAVFFPVAVVGVVKIMMLRPHVLRHAGDHAQEKTDCSIEPLGAKKLPWPHSCINTKPRKVNKLISSTAAAESQQEMSMLNSRPPKSARDVNVVRTCVKP